jgi:hypothetical protein
MQIIKTFLTNIFLNVKNVNLFVQFKNIHYFCGMKEDKKEKSAYFIISTLCLFK